MARTKRKNIAVEQKSTDQGVKIYRTAIYVRLSGEDERKIESESVENQMELLKEFVEKEPSLSLTDSYVDRGVSGTKFDRPEFNRMIADIKAGRIDCVVVKDLSRLGRNYLEAGNYLEKIFPFFGVRFIAVTDHYDSISSNVMEDGLLVPLKNLINESYAKDISRKITTANENRFRQGIYSSRSVAYGYKRDPEDASRLLVDEEIKDVVKRIFGECISGKGYCEIARGLNEDGISSPRVYKLSKQKSGKKNADNRWTSSTIKLLLKNPVYTGDILLGKMHQCYYKGAPKPVKREGFYIENHHEAIIDHETYRKAQKMLESSKKREDKKVRRCNVGEKKRPNLLGGFLYCGDCGRRMQICRSYNKHINGETVVYSRYNCTRSSIYGASDIEKSNSAEKVEKIVLDLIKEYIRIYLEARDRIQILNRKPNAKRKCASIDKKLRNIEARITEIKGFVRNLYEDFSDGMMSEEEYLETKASYVAEMDKLEDDAKELKKLLETYLTDYSGDKEVESACLKYKGEEELSRGMVETFIKKITCYSKDRFDVEYNYSDEVQSILNICAARGGDAS